MNSAYHFVCKLKIYTNYTKMDVESITLIISLNVMPRVGTNEKRNKKKMKMKDKIQVMVNNISSETDVNNYFGTFVTKINMTKLNSNKAVRTLIFKKSSTL